MILIVDNYDSFVHNIARYFEELGEQPHVVRNDEVTPADLKAKAIVISPGPCTPHEAGQSLAIVGVVTSIMSLFFLPIKARATGEVMESRPCLTLASYSPTIR